MQGGTNVNANGYESVGDLIDKRRSTPKSVHMSINLAPRFGETNKSSVRMLKESSTTTQNPTRVFTFFKRSSLLPCVQQTDGHS